MSSSRCEDRFLRHRVRVSCRRPPPRWVPRSRCFGLGGAPALVPSTLSLASGRAAGAAGGAAALCPRAGTAARVCGWTPVVRAAQGAWGGFDRYFSKFLSAFLLPPSSTAARVGALDGGSQVAEAPFIFLPPFASACTDGHVRLTFLHLCRLSPPAAELSLVSSEF